MSISRRQLTDYVNQYLQIDRFKDYCPNGLQIEGKNTIQTIVTGVSISQELIAKAIALKADAIFVHHGFFWKNESPVIAGIKKQRISMLLKNNINLYAYHLPLDAHLEIGNNVQLAKQLGLNIDEVVDELLFIGHLKKPQSLSDFASVVQKQLARAPTILGTPNKRIQRVAWCTGGAQQMMSQAIDFDVDLYISGEISEPNFHAANESKTAYLAAGHHATERYGIQALGEHLEKVFKVDVYFVDLFNPI